MTRNEIREEYFVWLCDQVYKKRFSAVISYDRLLRRLHETEFIFLIPMDENRADDGVELRWQFVCDDYAPRFHGEIMDELDGPCSVLEMMVALCVRCEEFMDDTSMGDRTGQWFWGMIKNLGLDTMTDDRFDIRSVDDILETFLNREYHSNGSGGLFTIKNCDRDLRTVEIWHQLCWYLDSIT